MTKVNIFKQCLEILALERFIPWLVGGRNMFLHKLLFLVIISGTNVNAVVIPNFTTNGISYYFYVFNEVTRLNYPEARTFCDNLGGSIAKVDSFDLGYEIQYQLQTFENDSDSRTWETPLDKGYWVSGYCTGGVGEWWFEDGERIVDTMWNEDEPDPATNTSHLFIISISPASGLWGSEDMSKFKNVICQISPPDGNSTGTEPTTTPLTSSSTPIYDSPKLEAELLFNGSLFMFYTGSYHGGWKFNFNQSQAWCVELGGSLALIKNNLTQHMITEQLFAMLPYVQPHGGGGDYWVGGEGVENDQQQEWVWLDGDNIDDGFTNWFSGYGSYEADYAVYDLGLAVVATDEDGLGEMGWFPEVCGAKLYLPDRFVRAESMRE
uniref:macrophage mannose receptor 1-like isoform X2 n=1 Tax=Ciona intestinalis TaxID=7719 RepID=UPI000EF4420B|nr:macrophage mannose receptor 1-like isoform X2 [Ciona intestinalis]|eukprot:XP_026695917.1 macrophage mannose receptor 1-like isoform X2 [Ciona intestinalis]